MEGNQSESWCHKQHQRCYLPNSTTNCQSLLSASKIALTRPPRTDSGTDSGTDPGDF